MWVGDGWTPRTCVTPVTSSTQLLKITVLGRQLGEGAVFETQ